MWLTGDDYKAATTVSGYGNPYMYTARRFDDESGLYYYRNRHYSPEIKRFIQPDPIGYADGMNMYSYCGNNPVNFVDPWGLLDKHMGRWGKIKRGFWSGVDDALGFTETRPYRGISTCMWGVSQVTGGSAIILSGNPKGIPLFLSGAATGSLGLGQIGDAYSKDPVLDDYKGNTVPTLIGECVGGEKGRAITEKIESSILPSPDHWSIDIAEIIADIVDKSYDGKDETFVEKTPD